MRAFVPANLPDLAAAQLESMVKRRARVPNHHARFFLYTPFQTEGPAPSNPRVSSTTRRKNLAEFPKLSRGVRARERKPTIRLIPGGLSRYS